MDEIQTPPPSEMPAATPVAPRPTTASGRAIASLVLGIATLLCCGFLTGIPAFFLGRSEEKAINRGESPEGGRTIAKVGWILGLIGTILSCLSILGMTFYMWKVGIPQMQQRGF
jgi:hypothetical protein